MFPIPAVSTITNNNKQTNKQTNQQIIIKHRDMNKNRGLKTLKNLCKNRGLKTLLNVGQQNLRYCHKTLNSNGKQNPRKWRKIKQEMEEDAAYKIRKDKRVYLQELRE